MTCLFTVCMCITTKQGTYAEIYLFGQVKVLIFHLKCMALHRRSRYSAQINSTVNTRI